MTDFLNVRMVLVETSHPGNIGASARAMKTMGLSRLFLVKPNKFPHAEATARASGADDILANAIVYESLQEALTGCTLTIACSARVRSLRWPLLSPRECAQTIVAKREEAALVFGRENSGLTNDELDHCQYMMQIPSQSDFSSLNLAAAVQIQAYELYISGKSSASFTEQPSLEAGEGSASVEEIEGFYRHLETTLKELEFLNPGNPKQLMRRLRRLYGRIRPSYNEINILRGILTAAQRARKP